MAESDDALVANPTRPAPRSLPHTVRRGVAAAVDHPLVTVAVVGLLLTVLHCAWVLERRPVGAFDVDEANLLFRAFRIQREIDAGDPKAVLLAANETDLGPFVTMSSAWAMTIGTRSVAWAMVVQPLFVALAAVGSAGAVRAVAGRGAALVAGIAALTVPVSLLASRHYQVATATAAGLSVALWMIVTSERGERRTRMIAAGAAIGAMLLARTMAVAFLPAVAVAIALTVARTKRSAVNVAAMIATIVLVAGPWWWLHRNGIANYLSSYGYGRRSNLYGETTLGERLGTRLEQLGRDLRLFVPLLAGAALLVGTSAIGWARRQTRLRGWPVLDRRLAAMWSVTLLGYAALLSSSNVGQWFELPLIFPLVAAVVTTGRMALPRPEGPATPRVVPGVLAAAVVVVGALTATLSAFDPGAPAAPTLLGSLDSYLINNASVDHRLASTSRRTREVAAAEWAVASKAVAEATDRVLGDDAHSVTTVAGSAHLINAGTIGLAQELGALARSPIDAPFTTGSDAELLESIGPRTDGRTQVLVVIRAAAGTLENDTGADRLLRLALRRGWRRTDTVKLPVGGDVTVLAPSAEGEPG